MSTYVRLTLIGLYKHVPELFDMLALPPAYDRDTFIDTVLLDHGEKRVVYPEPDFFKYAVGVWSRKWAASLERIALALESEYNPIYNYDRFEKWEEHEQGDYKNRVEKGGEDVLTRDGTVTTTETGSTTTTETGTVTTANNGTVTTQETGTTSETTTDMTTERTVSAFNENGYQPDEKSVVNGTVTREPDTTQTVTPNTTETVTPDTTQTVTPDTTQTVTPDTTETVTPDTTDTTQYGGTEDGSGDDRRDRRHNAHSYGNIGVTTSMQMINEEIDLRTNNNMYAIAAELFADDLLLMLY